MQHLVHIKAFRVSLNAGLLLIHLFDYKNDCFVIKQYLHQAEAVELKKKGSQTSKLGLRKPINSTNIGCAGNSSLM